MNRFKHIFLKLTISFIINNYITLTDQLIVVHNLSIIDQENLLCIQ